MNYYPISLNIRGKSCIVVGGGRVAERKVRTLLTAGAQVKIISPNITPGLAELAKSKQITLAARPYWHGDLQDCFLVICATDDNSINQQIAEDAQQRNILVNVVDDPVLGNFAIPAQLARKDLLFTVSTGGKSPAFAKLIKEDLTKHYGPEYGEYLDFFAKLRTSLQQQVTSSNYRGSIWSSVSKEIFTLLQAGKYDEAEEKITNAIGRIGAQS